MRSAVEVILRLTKLSSRLERLGDDDAYSNILLLGVFTEYRKFDECYLGRSQADDLQKD